MASYKKGLFLIEGKNGVEIFLPKKAVFGCCLSMLCNHPEKEYVYSFCIECEGDPLPLYRGEDPAGFSAPKLEINYWTGSATVPEKIIENTIFEVKDCVSPKYGHQNVLYRVSHENIDNVKIEFLSVFDGQIDVKIEGDTWDVAITGDEANMEDGGDEPAKIRIYATLKLDEKQAPSFD